MPSATYLLKPSSFL